MLNVRPKRTPYNITMAHVTSNQTSPSGRNHDSETVDAANGETVASPLPPQLSPGEYGGFFDQDTGTFQPDDDNETEMDTGSTLAWSDVPAANADNFDGRSPPGDDPSEPSGRHNGRVARVLVFW